MKLELLRCFKQVAESGGLSAAASELNRSPAALSMMLKQFEQQLGSSLFETDRKNKLSAVGAYTLEQVTLELDRHDKTIQNLKNFARGSTGIIRIGCVPSIACNILPTAIEQFVSHSPNVQIELWDTDSASLLEALRTEQIDVAIGCIPDSLQVATRVPLFKDYYGAVYSDQHSLIKHSSTLSWSELESQTLIVNDLCDAIRQPQLQSMIERASLRVYTTSSLLAMVRAGIGITVLPELAFRVSPQNLQFSRVRTLNESRQIELVIRAGNTVVPATQILIGFVEKAVNAYKQAV